MAGAILISEDNGMATSTIEFDYLVERIRDAFVSGDAVIVSEVYRPFDEEGMTFISAIGLDAREYRIFANAVEKARSAAEQEASFVSYREKWRELMSLIERDPRFVPLPE